MDTIDGTVRRQYILARLNKDTLFIASLLELYPDLESDSELSSVNTILDALEDLDHTQYPLECEEQLLTPSRESLLEYIINLELVLRGARLMYLFDAVTVDLKQELERRLIGILPRIQGVMSQNGYIVFVLAQTTTADYAATMMNMDDDDNPALVMLGYGYTKKDSRVHPLVGINFSIENKYHLYSFTCPESKYHPSILEESKEKAKTFTDVLSPLGFEITVRLMCNDV